MEDSLLNGNKNSLNLIDCSFFLWLQFSFVLYFTDILGFPYFQVPYSLSLCNAVVQHLVMIHDVHTVFSEINLDQLPC
jgi:hypothetical protein